MCSHVADRVGALVVSVDYRLAPEHPAPAAVDDCRAVLATLLAGRGEGVPGVHPFEVDPARVAVLGDSAGGNIAALLAIAHRDALRAGIPDAPPAPLRHQVLLYPAVDLTLASPSVAARPGAPLLRSARVHGFRDLYLGAGGLDPADPVVSPLHAPDHTDLAPALVVTTDLDPLEDDGVRYAEALRRAGVAVRYTCYHDVPHGFLSLPGPAPMAHQGLAEVVQELRGALA
jgi:acetyl esterase